jgi:hypothetical protein
MASVWTTGTYPSTDWTDNTYNDGIYIGDPPPNMLPYIGDPIPDWRDWSTPYTPGHVEIAPYYPYYPEKDNKEDFKKILEEMLSEKEKADKEKAKEENLMKVFEVTVVDKRECEILHEQKVIAKDTETAMIELNLTPEIKKKARKNLIEFIFNEIGSFTKAERKVRVKDLVDDED